MFFLFLLKLCILAPKTLKEDNLSDFILHRHTRDRVLFLARSLISISLMLPQAVTEKQSTG